MKLILWQVNICIDILWTLAGHVTYTSSVYKEIYWRELEVVLWYNHVWPCSDKVALNGNSAHCESCEWNFLGPIMPILVGARYTIVWVHGRNMSCHSRFDQSMFTFLVDCIVFKSHNLAFMVILKLVDLFNVFMVVHLLGVFHGLFLWLCAWCKLWLCILKLNIAMVWNCCHSSIALGRINWQQCDLVTRSCAQLIWTKQKIMWPTWLIGCVGWRWVYDI